MKTAACQPTDRRLRVLLCGYGHLGLALLQGLLERADICEIVGVFRWSARPASANCWEPVEEHFRRLVQQASLREIRCEGVNSYAFTTILQELKPDVLLVGAWGEIIQPHVLQHPGLIAINCHPSKLPGHRGANPYASVIRQQETETGVSFHRVSARIDAGPILLQQTVALDPHHETGATVRDKCTEVACEMVKSLADVLFAHVCHGKPLVEQEQDHAFQSYFPPLGAEDGRIDWERMPEDLHRQARALYPWLMCFGRLPNGRTVLFQDPYFMPRPEIFPDGAPAGTILLNERGILWIALSDPAWVLRVSAYQVSVGNTYLPVWLSRLISPFWLGAGRRFAGS